MCREKTLSKYLLEQLIIGYGSKNTLQISTFLSCIQNHQGEIYLYCLSREMTKKNQEKVEYIFQHFNSSCLPIHSSGRKNVWILRALVPDIVYAIIK